MNCDNCPQKNNHKYVWAKRLTGLNDIPQAGYDLLDRKLRNETQCECVPRYNLARTEVIIECCRDTALTENDVNGWGFDDYAVWTKEEANAYLQSKAIEWEEVYQG
jgi:hypothetical protein